MQLRAFARAFALPTLALLASCASGGSGQVQGGATSTATTTEPPTSSGAQTSAAPRDPTTARITVIALSDFHGWLLPLEPAKGYTKFYGGIANIAGMLEHKEKIDPATSIVLDNGDMWTGSTEGTFLRGAPVIEAYNALGVVAANIANHEFDFGQEILVARAGEAKFPFLGANIYKTGTTERPAWVKPWTIVERDGIKVAVIGLSYLDTPKTTLAKHLDGLEFKPYAETLKAAIPAVKKEGAEVIVLLFHETPKLIEGVLKDLPADLTVHAVIAGQDHRKGEASVNGTPIVNPGPWGRSYVRFDVEVDRATKKVAPVKYAIVDVTGEVGSPPAPPSAKLAAIAEAARQKTKALAKEVLGKVSGPLPSGTFGDSALGHLIVDSWLEALPDAEIAICNHGAIRQPLPAGPITIGDLLAVLPFENNLYVVQLTGKQLKEQLAIDGPVVAGLTWKYKETPKGRVVVSAIDKKGQPIADSKTYDVVINDFMYLGGDHYTFKDADPTPDDTGISLREPMARMLRTAESAGRVIAPPTGARAVKTK